MPAKVYFVGSHSEVAHHAAPLESFVDYQIAEPNKVLDSAEPGDLAVFFSEHFDRFRDCISQLKQRNVATLYLIDGILEWRNAWENRSDEPACPWTMRPALCHKVACIGYTQLSMLNSWGNSSRTELVGVPRFDRFRKETQLGKSTSDRFRVLLMSAKCPGFTEDQIKTTLQGFRDLKDWFDQNESINGRKLEPIWRLTGGLDEHLQVENFCEEFTGQELAETVANVDAVISTPSTATLEAMLMGRPVAVLNYHNSPQLVPTAWNISAATHIESTIRDLESPSEVRMEYQRNCLDSTLLPTTNATQRLSDLISQMLDVAKGQSKNESLQFPVNMLGDLKHPLPLSFDHQKLFPTFEEFTNPEILEIQSQLAHSRREIEHLHSEIDQLKSELGQAHEIFEQIHRHPVAGPIVRIRQKLIDWMQRHKQQAKPDRKPPLKAEVDAPASETPVTS